MFMYETNGVHGKQYYVINGRKKKERNLHLNLRLNALYIGMLTI